MKSRVARGRAPFAAPTARRAGVPAPPEEPRGAPPCYFSAACLEVRGEGPEGVYETSLFRLFGEEYVRKLPGGDGLAAGYRMGALRVVGEIERRADAPEIYADIYESFAAPVLALLIVGRWEEAYEIYREMRAEIEGRFLGEGRGRAPFPEQRKIHKRGEA